MTEASLRWLVHHSKLHGKNGDKIIVGASKMDHYRSNMDALAKGPLPEEVVAVFDKASAIVQPVWPCYFRSHSGSALESVQ
jgi:aflatoxin B1 aldehyde reductase